MDSRTEELREATRKELTMKRTTGILAAGLIAIALAIPAVAFARSQRAPGDDVTIVSAKVPLNGGQTKGWAFYCPSSEPYLQGMRVQNDEWVPGYYNMSDSGVSATWNGAYTDPWSGKLAITFTNWNLFHGRNGQVSYGCTTQQPS
jgi:hypothetical protein